LRLIPLDGKNIRIEIEPPFSGDSLSEGMGMLTRLGHRDSSGPSGELQVFIKDLQV